jgi:hypothetical protein
VWSSELGPAPPFPPMRVLEVKWSRALSLVCEVALSLAWLRAQSAHLSTIGLCQFNSAKLYYESKYYSCLPLTCIIRRGNSCPNHTKLSVRFQRVKLLGIMLGSRCWPTTCHTIAARGAAGWCQKWIVWSVPQGQCYTNYYSGMWCFMLFIK